jgi:hypothetical protein
MRWLLLEHAPESKDEKAAARVVMAYVDGLVRECPDKACLVVAEPMATEMRCATRPRIPRDMQMGPTSERPRVAHISLSGDEGHAWIANVSPGPLEDVSLRRVETAWRVVGKSGGYRQNRYHDDRPTDPLVEARLRSSR